MNPIKVDINDLDKYFVKSELTPAIAFDVDTKTVLMLAYMNKESLKKTLETGYTWYWSRSRQEYWNKGATSGHLQKVVSIYADCDNDTLLINVKQTGAACHTGSYSCFFNEIVKKEYIEKNPLKVFETVYNIIEDRKNNPKEGSYTNYLFDKGIDKILKKVGEECTEVIIAAAKKDKDETIYELADLCYHAMVLMADAGISVEDVTKELAKRHVVDHKVKQEYMR